MGLQPLGIALALVTVWALVLLARAAWRGFARYLKGDR